MHVNFLVHIIGDHADDVNILGRSVHTVKKNTESLVVASNDRTLMFQCVRAHWQPNSYLLAAVRCTNLVLRHTAMSIVEDVEKLIWKVERRPSLY